MQNSASGVLEVQVDNAEPFTVDLFAKNVTCGVFFEYDIGGNDTHTVFMSLFGPSPSILDPAPSLQPVLHLSSITYAADSSIDIAHIATDAFFVPSGTRRHKRIQFRLQTCLIIRM